MADLMGKLVNHELGGNNELITFDNLALGTHNSTFEIIEAHVGSTSPSEVKAFTDAHAAYIHTLLSKRDHVLRGGSMTDYERELAEKYATYDTLRKKYETDPSLAFLSNPIHRKEFKVRPYPIKGKHMPPNPYLGATSAMDGLWPGYDKPEYFDEYPFLCRYKGIVPEGKVMHTFLDEHRLFFNFPETVSRYGVLFVPPPYLPDELNVKLRQHLSKCDQLYHTTARVKPDNTVAEAQLVLSYLEDDMVAVVEDSGGKCIGVVSWKDLEGKNANDPIAGMYQTQWNEAPSGELSAEQAFMYMADKSRNWTYMLKDSEHGMRIVTKTTAAVSHFLPPHTFKQGLGSALYLGISDVSLGDKLIDTLESDADGVPAVIVETAHADTPYFRKILAHYRERLQDVFLMAGTTIDPEAVQDFLVRYGADGVKLGIAEGRACRTSNTGIGIPNAHVGLDCGASAAGQGYLMLDGWGNSGEFIKGLAMSGIQMRQGGGAFVGRRESANPWLKNGGDTRGKYYRGMAGTDVQELALIGQQLSPAKLMELTAHLHSEGAEVFVPQRSPSTVGRMLLAHMFLLTSAMSYSGVRKELERPVAGGADGEMENHVLEQFHRLAQLYVVTQTAA